MTWLRMMILGARNLRQMAAWATAQDDFPSKPVHIYVPFSAGLGAVDIVGRTLGDELSRRWSQSVIIENRPGAGGGAIATQALGQGAGRTATR